MPALKYYILPSEEDIRNLTLQRKRILAEEGESMHQDTMLISLKHKKSPRHFLFIN